MHTAYVHCVVAVHVILANSRNLVLQWLIQGFRKRGTKNNRGNSLKKRGTVWKLRRNSLKKGDSLEIGGQSPAHPHPLIRPCTIYTTVHYQPYWRTCPLVYYWPYLPYKDIPCTGPLFPAWRPRSYIYRMIYTGIKNISQTEALKEFIWHIPLFWCFY
jgi:hypothetical protein